MGQRGAEHAAAQFRVEREAHAVADDRGMRGRNPFGQGQRRGAISDESNVQVLEERTTDSLRSRAHSSFHALEAQDVSFFIAPRRSLNIRARAGSVIPYAALKANRGSAARTSASGNPSSLRTIFVPSTSDTHL